MRVRSNPWWRRTRPDRAEPLRRAPSCAGTLGDADRYGSHRGGRCAGTRARRPVLPRAALHLCRARRLPTRACAGGSTGSARRKATGACGATRPKRPCAFAAPPRRRPNSFVCAKRSTGCAMTSRCGIAITPRRRWSSMRVHAFSSRSSSSSPPAVRAIIVLCRPRPVANPRRTEAPAWSAAALSACARA